MNPRWYILSAHIDETDQLVVSKEELVINVENCHSWDITTIFRYCQRKGIKIWLEVPSVDPGHWYLSHAINIARLAPKNVSTMIFPSAEVAIIEELLEYLQGTNIALYRSPQRDMPDVRNLPISAIVCKPGEIPQGVTCTIVHDRRDLGYNGTALAEPGTNVLVLEGAICTVVYGRKDLDDIAFAEPGTNILVPAQELEKVA